MRALVQAGKEADLRRVQAEAGMSAAEAELQAATADQAETLAKLTSLAGSSEPFTSIETSLLAVADRLRTPTDELPGSPAGVAIALADREAAARRVRVERSKAAPDVTVSVGARRLEGVDGTALVAGVSLPLPLFDRNKGSITAASARLAAAEARLRGARLDAEAERRSASAQAFAGQARLASAAQAETAAREGYRLARIGYEGGKTSLLDVLSARRSLTEAATRLIDARLARIRAEARLARLADRPLLGEAQ